MSGRGHSEGDGERQEPPESQRLRVPASPGDAGHSPVSPSALPPPEGRSLYAEQSRSRSRVLRQSSRSSEPNDGGPILSSLASAASPGAGAKPLRPLSSSLTPQLRPRSLPHRSPPLWSPLTNTRDDCEAVPSWCSDPSLRLLDEPQAVKRSISLATLPSARRDPSNIDPRELNGGSASPPEQQQQQQWLLPWIWRMMYMGTRVRRYDHVPQSDQRQHSERPAIEKDYRVCMRLCSSLDPLSPSSLTNLPGSLLRQSIRDGGQRTLPAGIGAHNMHHLLTSVDSLVFSSTRARARRTSSVHRDVGDSANTPTPEAAVESNVPAPLASSSASASPSSSSVSSASPPPHGAFFPSQRQQLECSQPSEPCARSDFHRSVSSPTLLSVDARAALLSLTAPSYVAPLALRGRESDIPHKGISQTQSLRDRDRATSPDRAEIELLRLPLSELLVVRPGVHAPGFMASASPPSLRPSDDCCLSLVTARGILHLELPSPPERAAVERILHLALTLRALNARHGVGVSHELHPPPRLASRPRRRSGTADGAVEHISRATTRQVQEQPNLSESASSAAACRAEVEEVSAATDNGDRQSSQERDLDALYAELRSLVVQLDELPEGDDVNGTSHNDPQQLLRHELELRIVDIYESLLRLASGAEASVRPTVETAEQHESSGSGRDGGGSVEREEKVQPNVEQSRGAKREKPNSGTHSSRQAQAQILRTHREMLDSFHRALFGIGDAASLLTRRGPRVHCLPRWLPPLLLYVSARADSQQGATIRARAVSQAQAGTGSTISWRAGQTEKLHPSKSLCPRPRSLSLRDFFWCGGGSTGPPGPLWQAEGSLIAASFQRNGSHLGDDQLSDSLDPRGGSTSGSDVALPIAAVGHHRSSPAVGAQRAEPHNGNATRQSKGKWRRRRHLKRLLHLSTEGTGKESERTAIMDGRDEEEEAGIHDDGEDDAREDGKRQRETDQSLGQSNEDFDRGRPSGAVKEAVRAAAASIDALSMAAAEAEERSQLAAEVDSDGWSDSDSDAYGDEVREGSLTKRMTRRVMGLRISFWQKRRVVLRTRSLAYFHVQSGGLGGSGSSSTLGAESVSSQPSVQGASADAQQPQPLASGASGAENESTGSAETARVSRAGQVVPRARRRPHRPHAAGYVHFRDLLRVRHMRLKDKGCRLQLDVAANRVLVLAASSQREAEQWARDISTAAFQYQCRRLRHWRPHQVDMVEQEYVAMALLLRHRRISSPVASSSAPAAADPSGSDGRAFCFKGSNVNVDMDAVSSSALASLGMRLGIPGVASLFASLGVDLPGSDALPEEARKRPLPMIKVSRSRSVVGPSSIYDPAAYFAMGTVSRFHSRESDLRDAGRSHDDDGGRALGGVVSAASAAADPSAQHTPPVSPSMASSPENVSHPTSLWSLPEIAASTVVRPHDDSFPQQSPAAATFRGSSAHQNQRAFPPSRQPHPHMHAQLQRQRHYSHHQADDSSSRSRHAVSPGAHGMHSPVVLRSIYCNVGNVSSSQSPLQLCFFEFLRAVSLASTNAALFQHVLTSHVADDDACLLLMLLHTLVDPYRHLARAAKRQQHQQHQGGLVASSTVEEYTASLRKSSLTGRQTSRASTDKLELDFGNLPKSRTVDAFVGGAVSDSEHGETHARPSTATQRQLQNSAEDDRVAFRPRPKRASSIDSLSAFPYRCAAPGCSGPPVKDSRLPFCADHLSQLHAATEGAKAQGDPSRPHQHSHSRHRRRRSKRRGGSGGAAGANGEERDLDGIRRLAHLLDLGALFDENGVPSEPYLSNVADSKQSGSVRPIAPSLLAMRGGATAMLAAMPTSRICERDTTAQILKAEAYVNGWFQLPRGVEWGNFLENAYSWARSPACRHAIVSVLRIRSPDDNALSTLCYRYALRVLFLLCLRDRQQHTCPDQELLHPSHAGHRPRGSIWNVLRANARTPHSSDYKREPRKTSSIVETEGRLTSRAKALSVLGMSEAEYEREAERQRKRRELEEERRHRLLRRVRAEDNRPPYAPLPSSPAGSLSVDDQGKRGWSLVAWAKGRTPSDADGEDDDGDDDGDKADTEECGKKRDVDDERKGEASAKPRSKSKSKSSEKEKKGKRTRTTRSNKGGNSHDDTVSLSGSSRGDGNDSASSLESNDSHSLPSHSEFMHTTPAASNDVTHRAALASGEHNLCRACRSTSREFAALVLAFCSGRRCSAVVLNTLMDLLLHSAPLSLRFLQLPGPSQRTVLNNSVWQPSVWRALFCAMAGCDFALRRQTLEDVNALLINSPSNRDILLAQPGWQTWVGAMLEDITLEDLKEAQGCEQQRLQQQLQQQQQRVAQQASEWLVIEQRGRAQTQTQAPQDQSARAARPASAHGAGVGDVDIHRSRAYEAEEAGGRARSSTTTPPRNDRHGVARLPFGAPIVLGDAGVLAGDAEAERRANVYRFALNVFALLHFRAFMVRQSFFCDLLTSLRTVQCALNNGPEARVFMNRMLSSLARALNPLRNLLPSTFSAVPWSNVLALAEICRVFVFSSPTIGLSLHLPSHSPSSSMSCASRSPAPSPHPLSLPETPSSVLSAAGAGRDEPSRRRRWRPWKHDVGATTREGGSATLGAGGDVPSGASRVVRFGDVCGIGLHVGSVAVEEDRGGEQPWRGVKNRPRVVTHWECLDCELLNKVVEWMKKLNVEQYEYGVQSMLNQLHEQWSHRERCLVRRIVHDHQFFLDSLALLESLDDHLRAGYYMPQNVAHIVEGFASTACSDRLDLPVKTYSANRAQRAKLLYFLETWTASEGGRAAASSQSEASQVAPPPSLAKTALAEEPPVPQPVPAAAAAAAVVGVGVGALRDGASTPPHRRASHESRSRRRDLARAKSYHSLTEMLAASSVPAPSAPSGSVLSRASSGNVSSRARGLLAHRSSLAVRPCASSSSLSISAESLHRTVSLDHFHAAASASASTVAAVAPPPLEEKKHEGEIQSGFRSTVLLRPFVGSPLRMGSSAHVSLPEMELSAGDTAGTAGPSSQQQQRQHQSEPSGIAPSPQQFVIQVSYPRHYHQMHTELSVQSNVTGSELVAALVAQEQLEQVDYAVVHESKVLDLEKPLNHYGIGPTSSLSIIVMRPAMRASIALATSSSWDRPSTTSHTDAERRAKKHLRALERLRSISLARGTDQAGGDAAAGAAEASTEDATTKEALASHPPSNAANSPAAVASAGRRRRSQSTLPRYTGTLPELMSPPDANDTTPTTPENGGMTLADRHRLQRALMTPLTRKSSDEQDEKAVPSDEKWPSHR